MRKILTSHRNYPQNDGSTSLSFGKEQVRQSFRIMEESLRVRMTHVHRSLFLTVSVPKDPPLNDSTPPLEGRQE
jgi:hypothetical protein